jgi:hypothetical protein
LRDTFGRDKPKINHTNHSGLTNAPADILDLFGSEQYKTNVLSDPGAFKDILTSKVFGGQNAAAELGPFVCEKYGSRGVPDSPDALLAQLYLAEGCKISLVQMTAALMAGFGADLVESNPDVTSALEDTLTSVMPEHYED